MSRDRLVTILAACAVPLIAVGIDVHFITAAVGADIGAVIAAFVGAYHLPNDAARAALSAAQDTQGASLP